MTEPAVRPGLGSGARPFPTSLRVGLLQGDLGLQAPCILRSMWQAGWPCSSPGTNRGDPGILPSPPQDSGTQQAPEMGDQLPQSSGACL